MVKEDQLSQILAEFARTLATDYPIQAILDHLTTRATEVLPATGAGVLLVDADEELHFVSASDDVLLRIEALQIELREGPCLEAFRTAARVLIPDLRHDKRFPRFSPRAADEGLAAVYTFPLRTDAGCIGAFDVYNERPTSLPQRATTVCQILADVASAYIANARNRLESREAEEQLRHRALHDPLTGLPNRTLLHDRIGQAIARMRREHSTPAVLFIDLDRFKAVNDLLGHDVGDQLLIAVTQRLEGLLRPGDTLARLAGDEFVVLCEDLGEARQAAAVAQRITGALAHPFQLDGRTVFVAASVGIAFANEGDEPPQALLRDADTAMYRAKKRGGASFEIIDETIRAEALRRLETEHDLHQAVEGHQLRLDYQPIASVEDGSIERVEALLRWDHPVRGWLLPGEFLLLAEDTKLIIPVGQWVLAEACRAARRWQRLVGQARTPTVAVNVSAVQLMDPGFTNLVASTLDETDIDPGCLFLEITESVLMDDARGSLNRLDEFKRMGVRLSVDDFGTGYSSLEYLQRFPVDQLKVDRTFVDGLGSQQADSAIVKAVVSLGHALGLEVVAEGVEHDRQLAELQAIGCDYAQGFHVARPMRAEGIDRLLTAV